MAQKQLMETDAPVSAASQAPAVEIPDKAPPVGQEALAASSAASRELMPVTQAQVDRPSFDRPAASDLPTPQTNAVTSKETVSGNLKELLSSDSQYLEQGRQVGLTQAAQRGLQNSTMAIQAGEQARIAAALPIAQQDAATYNQRATLNQNTVNEFRINEMDHMQSMIERAQQGDINAQLQLDQYGFNSALSAQQNIEQLERQALAGDIEAKQRYLDFSYNTILSGIQQGYALQLNDQQFQNSQRLLMTEFANASGLSAQDSQQRIDQLNQQHQNTLEEIGARTDAATTEREVNLGFQLQAQYLADVAARQQSASDEIRIIYQTEGLKASQQQSAVIQAQNRLNADIRALQAYYAKSPQWDDDFGRVAVTPRPPGGQLVNPSTQTPYPTPGYRVPGGSYTSRTGGAYDRFTE